MGKYEADRRQSDRSTTEMDRVYRQMTDSPTRKQPSPQQIAARRKAQKNQRIAIIASCSVLLVILIILIVIMLIGPGGSSDDGKILPNVYAAGIDLGGMTPEEAKSALHLATDKTFSQKEMELRLPDRSLTLSPADTKASLDVDKVVEAAYDYGRDGSDKDYAQAKEKAQSTTYTIPLLPYLQLDMDYIDTAVQAFCDAHGSQMSQPSYELVGEPPAYDPEYPDLSVEHQILIITMGTPEYALSARDISDAILDAYSLNQMTVEYDVPTHTEPETPDAAALFQKYCIPAADATIDETTYQVTPEVYGYGFDIDAVQKMIDEAKYGQELHVEMMFLLPEVTAEDLTKDLFVDSLAVYTTALSSDGSDAWENNLELSVQAINGHVIKVGGEFSFNDILGKPTALKGYESAKVLRDGKETSVLGGGISQTASALYYCALQADLDILERHASSNVTNYGELGLDACVIWGSQDLRLRNNTDAPIKIIATADGSEVTVELLGIDDRDYRVEIKTDIVSEDEPETIIQVVDEENVYDYTDGEVLQEGITGYEVQTSVDKYHKETGELISSTLVDTSTYEKRDEIQVRVGALITDPTEDTEATDSSDPTEETTGTIDETVEGGLMDLLLNIFK